MTFAKTDIGLNRETNQDAFRTGAYPNGDEWVIICDGMGGVSGGHIASGICADKVAEALERGYRDKMTVRSVENMLESAITGANAAVFEESQKSVEYKGMGTTVVAAVKLGNLAVIAHVGDSRAYLVNDTITQITKDHSFVQVLVDTGKITEEEAKTHPDRNIITRAVGIENFVDVEVDIVDVAPGDKLLLCTDGLCGYVSDSEVLEIIKKYGDCSAEKLIESANNAGGYDNVTVALISADSQGE
ncbi:MAG: Stp1/IreP family PP2C-type Ser/Thr phosphatase [Acutalibacteraceae bacterium]